MSDLLASLVDRALDRTPVLQRRRPTPFEDTPEVSLTEQSRTENRSLLEEQENIIENGPSQERKHFVKDSSRLPAPTIRSEQPESEPVEAQPIRSKRLAVTPTQPNAGETAPLKPVATASIKETELSPEESRHELKPRVIAEPEVTRTPARLIETIVEKRVEREIVREHSADQPTIKETHTFVQADGPPKPFRETDGAQPKQPLKAEVKQLAPRKEQTTVKRLLEHKPPPRRDPSPSVRTVPRAGPKHPLQQATPPTIHVTIGRVEVRVTQPATKKPGVAQSVGPKMSLEDYLRSRGAGKS